MFISLLNKGTKQPWYNKQLVCSIKIIYMENIAPACCVSLIVEHVRATKILLAMDGRHARPCMHPPHTRYDR